jgi:hypothetical protein
LENQIKDLQLYLDRNGPNNNYEISKLDIENKKLREMLKQYKPVMKQCRLENEELERRLFEKQQ